MEKSQSTPKKERIDKLLVDKGLVETREKAQALIMSGVVFVNNQKIDKPGTKIPTDANIHIKEKIPYVSRGGFKLEKGIKVFNLDVKDKVCLDIGSSTGGFTDCLLQNGAKKVYAVDVGKNQLHEKLRSDPRVVSIEEFNARYLSKKEIPEEIDIVVADVSFISITKILPNICDILKEDFKGVILIKPQFELSKKEVKNGVVKDPSLHEKAIISVINLLHESCYCVKGLDFSPIKGPEGNIEFLAYIERKNKDCKPISYEEVKQVVSQAHETL
ncbi:TlyA family RNA methyltransferase [Sulfurihydrogenibium azorense]|jgi:23S rRNA (cytidine1920-2'-O)/16S rRNA (cytidine1409-2'-O)-methyltransferase|uniref:Hemolysin A n=1 Tax=Sulfurihydrogenibium azorense (strain DSM 15241 / OCM 825 / Az-Fu1) TaxID=204536 RepID=C1DTS0_SULAA|nr:TlyA family RNA methyltransferase [Sulfurihydrogenibium azorense]ACN99200.1 hemolysin A [Sulfurihydrogenibium azorense Az-Fu1]MDM7273077.1 TlyA family RNA methyltransferase [Sulfurihydrogenibium azorense]